MKKLFTLFVLAVCINTNAQTNNLGFETGDFTNWVGYEGHNTNSDSSLYMVTQVSPPPANLNSLETSCNYFSVITAGTDPLMGISLTSPLGGNCARMGGEYRNVGDQASAGYGCSDAPSGSYTNTAGEVLQTTFNVNTSNVLFNYAFLFCYADNGAHLPNQQPYFRATVLDAIGDTIHCYDYYQSGLNGVPPTGYAGSISTALFYTPSWYIQSMNLLPYLGQTITIRFTVAGCGSTAHFGYAYIDCNAGTFNGITVSSQTCTGATLTAPPLSGATYSWSGPGIVGANNTQSININQSGTYSVTETMACGTLGTFDTTITLSPTVNNTLTVCGNYNLNNHTYTVSGNYTDTLHTTQGCDSIVVTNLTVNPLPTITVNSATICMGQATATLCANGASTYTWVPSNDISATTGACVASTPSVLTIYTVTGTDANGCLNTATSTVVVNPLPTIGVNTPTICANDTVTICPFGASTYTVYPNAFVIGGSGGCISFNPSTSTSYTLFGTDANGCQNITGGSIFVNPSPTVNYTLTADATPHIWDAVPSVSGGTAPYTYLWSWGDGTTDNVLYTSHTYTAAAHYNICLTVTDANGCSSQYCENDSLYRTSQANQIVQINTVGSTSGISQASNQNNSFTIYPNPTSSTIQITGITNQDEIKIYDVLGNAVNTPLTPFKGGQAMLDASTLPSGVYFIKVGSSTQKFVKE